MPPTVTVSVNSLVRPTLRPSSIRNVPSVMMKLGRPVRVTSQPLKKPIASATTSATPIATQMFWWNSTATMPTVSAVVPVSTPADRSKWPPIISSATATAMMPSVEAGSSQLATPRADRNTGDWTAKNAKTTTAPTSAPSSGVTSSRRIGPRAVSRSSGPVVRSGVRPGVRAGARDAQRVPAEARSAICVDVLLVDDPGTGENRLATAHRVQVLHVELQHHDRQVPLLVLLLVDGEGDRTVLDALDDVLRSGRTSPRSPSIRRPSRR